VNKSIGDKKDTENVVQQLCSFLIRQCSQFTMVHVDAHSNAERVSDACAGIGC